MDGWTMGRMSNAELSRRVVLGTGLGVAAGTALGADVAAAETVGGLLRVGVLLDTSGPASTHGMRQLLGVRHQADVINAGSGAGVRLLVRDTQGDVDITRAHAEALLGKDNVDALIGTSMPETAAPVMELAQAARVPMVVPTVVSPPQQPFVFGSAANSVRVTRELMRALAAAAVRRAALLILDSLATPERMAVYRREAVAYGVELMAVERFVAPASTLTAPLHTLVAAAPEAVIVSAPPPFNGIAVRDARAIGWSGPLFCTSGAGHPGFLTTAGAAAEGVRVIAPWLLLGERAPDTLPNSWAIHQFVDSFTPRNGPVGTFAGFGADALAMLHNAFVGHRDRGQARERLEHMIYVGVTGVFRMTPTNHAGLDDAAITTVVVRDGTWSTDDGRP